MSLYLSRLTLNARHNRTRREFDCPYELHRTISNGWQDTRPARILFRAEEPTAGVVAVVVQSISKPDWSRLEAPKDYLREIHGPKHVELQKLAEGQHLRFRLRCRPSKRIASTAREHIGKRRGLTTKGEILGWLQRKGETGGFTVRQVGFDRVYWYDSKAGILDKPLGAIVFDGVLDVTDTEMFRDALRNGIGPQKAFGFGLLSVAPAQA